jgi:hypothetical protein
MRSFYYDIKAFLILRKEVLRNRNSPDWNRFNLRYDWLYRIYTVINPSEADKGDDDAMLNMKAVDKLAPINKYISSLGLAEIVALSMEKIPETDSYLVVYYQIYNWFTPWKAVSRLAALICGIWAIATYGSDMITGISDLFSWAYKIYNENK